MTGGERSWVGSNPPHFLFYLDLISYLSIYLLYLLLYLSVHNHFLTTGILVNVLLPVLSAVRHYT